MSLRGRLVETFVAEMLGSADLLHLPAVPETAPSVAATREIEEAFALNARLTPFLPAANCLGLPAIGVPAGFAGDGLPVGFQMIARPFAEATLLKAADSCQRVADWPTRLPPLS
jgi:aspartyl-tRNA(Asn)/glutamyl-tRNA(Gln) amidotransferase subunit A